MLQIDNSDIIEQHDDFVKAYLNGSNSPFLISDYMRIAFPKLEERANADRLQSMRKKNPNCNSIYPYEVKIPKSLDAMKQGDFSPAKTITITEPFKGAFSNIWFGTTLDGIKFRWGYVNGDSRKISEDSLDDSHVHGFLAGATGQGKSVTLNSVIYGLCSEYPPWELTLSLSDAKIVEFKTIATSHPMPHIDTIAATADTDYLLSFLQKKCKEMMDRNAVFTKAGEVFGVGVKNIKEFRKTTGLCLPRNILIFDESTAMFQMAGKRAGKIAELIDSIGRLGRNAGFHLLLTSQEVSSDLPEATLANLTLRGAMGCTGPISEKVIGNSAAASNLGKKGRLIVNSVRDKDNQDANVLVRVPFVPESEINEISDKIIQLGKSRQVQNTLRFYDEEAKLDSEKYEQFIHSFEQRDNRILLGAPSFIMDDHEQVVRIDLTGDDTENLCVFANSTKSKTRALRMLKMNLCQFSNNSHVLLCVDPSFKKGSDIDDLDASFVFEDRSYTTSQFFDVARSTIYRRMLCIKADVFAFKNPVTSEPVDKLFYSQFEKGSKQDTLINRCRFSYYCNYLNNDPEICGGFKLGAGDDERKMSLAANCIRLCEACGCADTPVTRESFPNTWFWLLGMERLIGLGRDPRTSNVDDFKKLLQDGTPVGVRFIIFTSSFEDLTGLLPGIGFFLADDLSIKQASQIKAGDIYPEKLADGLMVLFKPMIQKDEERLMKFKKLMLDEEM